MSTEATTLEKPIVTPAEMRKLERFAAVAFAKTAYENEYKEIKGEVIEVMERQGGLSLDNAKLTYVVQNKSYGVEMNKDLPKKVGISPAKLMRLVSIDPGKALVALKAGVITKEEYDALVVVKPTAFVRCDKI